MSAFFILNELIFSRLGKKTFTRMIFSCRRFHTNSQPSVAEKI